MTSASTEIPFFTTTDTYTLHNTQYTTANTFNVSSRRHTFMYASNALDKLGSKRNEKGKKIVWC